MNNIYEDIHLMYMTCHIFLGNSNKILICEIDEAASAK